MKHVSEILPSVIAEIERAYCTKTPMPDFKRVDELDEIDRWING